jgi:DNA-binding Lrp family transcriptional regulator
MKRPQQSRDFAAEFSADNSNGAFTETIGTTTENLNGSNGSGAIKTIDPNDNSYFIQYHPEVAEKLSKHNSTYSVSGRCLSIVASRMLYWSRYAKHRFQGKLWYWKNQTELGEETGFSVKQINRALKVLVELGIIIREKFQKHYYRQVYFYHIPCSPHTKELKQPSRTTSSSSRSTRSNRVGSGGSQLQQQFHSRSGGAVARPEAVVVSTNPVASGAPATATGGSAAPKTTSTIHQSKGFGSMGSKCPNQSPEYPTSIKQSLLSIVEKCKSYGDKDIYRERFGLVA